MRMTNLFFVLVLIALPAFSDNRELADVMLMLSDQSGGISALSKLAPVTVEDKLLKRNIARTRGAVILLSLLKEKKGTIVDGRLVPNSLTPEKFTTVMGEDLAALLTQYDKLVDDVIVVFKNAEAEILSQLAKENSARDFKELKKLLLKLDDAMKAAHTAFKPQQMG